MEPKVVLAHPFLGPVGVDLQHDPHAPPRVAASIGYYAKILVVLGNVDRVKVEIVAKVVGRNAFAVSPDMLRVGCSPQLVDGFLRIVPGNGRIVGVQIQIGELV